MVAVFAVFIVAVAASCINVGKALQKQGTKNLPRLVLDPKVIGTYLSDETWAAGMALDVFGGLLMVAAIARAPVSVVQPVAAGGVAVLAVYSHYKLGETLQAKEWAGVALAVIGTIGIGWNSEEQQPAELSGFRYLIGAFLVAAVVAAPGYYKWHATKDKAMNRLGVNRSGKKVVGLVGMGSPHHLRTSHQVGGTGQEGGGRVEEVFAGLQAGTFFSLSALACKLGFILGGRMSFMFVLLGLGASVGLTAFGLVCQTRGLKDGNSVVVCTCGNVAQMITAVVFGVVILGERLPTSTWTALRNWSLSWCMILGGVVLISGITVDDIPVEQIKESVDKGLGGLGGLQGLVNGMGGGRTKMILPLVNPPPRVKEGHSKE